MSFSYKNILVALDGSVEAESALKKAIEITKRESAKLHLCHVIEFYRYPGDSGFVKKAQEEFGNDLLKKYESFVKEHGVDNVNTILEFGSPKSVISKQIAKEVGADLIICGATGLNAVERVIVGSVSENIVRLANCDVLIVRSRTEEI